MSCLGCQHFISDWLGKLKPNKLSTGCQNELKGAAVEKATIFIFLATSPLVRPARQIRHATQASLVSSLPADVLWGSFVTHSFLPHGESVGEK